MTRKIPSKTSGYCMKHKYAYDRQCPNCVEEERLARRAEERRKFPHAELEARYQSVRPFFIVSGNDQTPFAKSEFFAGFHMHGLIFAPKWVKTQDDMVQPVMYFTREAVHTAMTELLKWYETEGVSHGIQKPDDLSIGFFV
jgi:hypothetical protein